MRHLLAVGVMLFIGGATCWAQQLLFTSPPLIADGRVYVPARELCDWLGAAIRWDGQSQAVRVTWRDHEEVWTAASGAIRLRSGRAYLRIREFADAFGEPVRWWHRMVDFGDYSRSTYSAIPVGWKPGTMPRGLSRDQQAIWRMLAKLGDPEDKGRCDVRDIRVVERWAGARVHPLNFVTDDLTVLLEKREGQWRVLASGTDLFSEGRNYGIPALVRRGLGLPR